MMQKVLVTGGAGFIGSHLIKLWLAEDKRVSIVNFDALTYCGDLTRLKEVESNPRYRFIQGDVCQAAQVESALEGCTDVVHLAAETHVDRSLLNSRSFIDTNIAGTYVLLEAARKKGVRKFLYVSTDEVYGSRDNGFFKEQDALTPTNPYSISKSAADFFVLSYAQTHGMHTLVTRGSNTFGSYQYPEKVIPLFISQALSDQKLPLYGDGLHVRNWLFAEDHCRGILTVLKKGKKGQAYNISSSIYLKNLELTRRILTILGKSSSLIQKVKDRAGHDRRYATDSKKCRVLGWKESDHFEDLLRATVRWYQENQSWWRAIKEKDKDFKQYYQKAYAER